MVTYKLVNDREGNPCSVTRSNGWNFPMNEANTDYQEYIEWTKESPANVAAPADE